MRNTIADYVTPAPGALNRNYNDMAVLAGFDYDYIEMMPLRVLVGYKTRSFNTSAMKTIQAPVVEATALYNLCELTTLATRQLEAAIANKLRRRKLLSDPSIAVEVVAYRPILVHGEVSKPGQCPFRPGMTMLTSVAIAGGSSYRAF